MESSLYLCKYKIDDVLVVFKDGSSGTIPKRNVVNFTIEKSYDDSFLPILAMECLVDKKLYNKINTDDSAKYRVTLYKSPLKASNSHYDPTKLFKNPFINEVFINLNDGDLSPDRFEDFENRKDEYSNIEDDRTDLQKDSYKVTLYLFVERHIHRYRRPNNYIFRNAMISDVILALSDLNGMDKLLLSQPDNKKEYSEVIIPPSTYLGAMDYIQDIYGVYDKSMMVFNDYDCLYIIDKDTKCKASRKGEIQRIYFSILEANKEKNDMLGYTEDFNSNRYYVNIISKPSIKNDNIKMKELLYNKIYSLNNNTGSIEKYNININTNLDNIHNIKLIEDKYDNKHAMSSMIYDISLNNHNMSIQIPEIDISILTPNKECYFSFQLKNPNYVKMTGAYKLTKHITSFIKSQEDIFIANTVAEFKRA